MPVKTASVIGWKNGKPSCLGYLAECGAWFMAFSSAGSDWMRYLNGPGGRCCGAAADPDAAANMVINRWYGCGYRAAVVPGCPF